MSIVEVLSIRRTVLPAAPRTMRRKKTAMTIQSESGGTVLSIPYAPTEVTHTNMIVEYVTVPRPGLIENVVYSNVQRPRMSLDLKVHDKVVVAANGARTLQRAISVIQSIQNMARKKTRVRIAYGALESGLWYIVSMSTKSTNRDPITDEITGAEVSLECLRGDTAISGTGTGTGPVTGGVTNPVGTAQETSDTSTIVSNVSKDPSKPAARYHVVRNGETLYALSIRYYKTGELWRKIGDANKIIDPRKLKIGTRLRIP